MHNDYFQFKQFTIRQGRCAMKVGTDGVLLGAWADVADCRRILDVGTGTGLIAIMAAQRNPLARVDAVEIDGKACGQAEENAKNCPWSDRVRVYHGTIQEFQPDALYDLILCNPPFFVHSTPAPGHERTIARHCETLSHQDLLQAADRLLTPSGRFCLILPIPEAENFIRAALSQEWFINKLTNVFPTPLKPRKRCMIELSHQDTPCEEDAIILEIERHNYHETFRRLVQDFYLKM